MLWKKVNKLRPVKADVTVNEVKAKINALRSRFSSELLKTMNKPSGSEMEDILKISFFYFEKILFLSDHVQARKGTRRGHRKECFTNSGIYGQSREFNYTGIQMLEIQK
ncbi:hypothetical protein CBL_12078 [Carabus blaptoides fortunei]